MYVRVYRKIGGLALRKWIIEARDEKTGFTVYEARIAGGPFFEWRLAVKLKRMVSMTNKANAVTKSVMASLGA